MAQGGSASVGCQQRGTRPSLQRASVQHTHLWHRPTCRRADETLLAAAVGSGSPAAGAQPPPPPQARLSIQMFFAKHTAPTLVLLIAGIPVGVGGALQGYGVWGARPRRSCLRVLQPASGPAALEGPSWCVSRAGRAGVFTSHAGGHAQPHPPSAAWPPPPPVRCRFHAETANGSSFSEGCCAALRSGHCPCRAEQRCAQLLQAAPEGRVRVLAAEDAMRAAHHRGHGRLSRWGATCALTDFDTGANRGQSRCVGDALPEFVRGHNALPCRSKWAMYSLQHTRRGRPNRGVRASQFEPARPVQGISNE